jgi:hypothetical protein
MDAYSKVASMGFSSKSVTLSDLKEGE